MKLLLTILCFLLFSIPSFAAEVTLAWDANDLTPEGYRVFSRVVNGIYDYSNPIWEGSSIVAVIQNLDNNTTYYFVVRAFDGKLESADSIEVVYNPKTDGLKVIKNIRRIK